MNWSDWLAWNPLINKGYRIPYFALIAPTILFGLKLSVWEQTNINVFAKNKNPSTTFASIRQSRRIRRTQTNSILLCRSFSHKNTNSKRKGNMNGVAIRIQTINISFISWVKTLLTFSMLPFCVSNSRFPRSSLENSFNMSTISFEMTSFASTASRWTGRLRLRS